jgi:hypothetical protein
VLGFESSEMYLRKIRPRTTCRQMKSLLTSSGRTSDSNRDAIIVTKGLALEIGELEIDLLAHTVKYVRRRIIQCSIFRSW